MLRHTLILSDVHLTTLVRDRTDGWLAYRRPELAPDELLARVIAQAHAEARKQYAFFELVFAGDLFDLDAPPECGEATRASYVGCRTDVGAEACMRRALADHPSFSAAVARVLADGTSRVIFVPGNHDAQLAFLGVRKAIVEAFAAESLPGRVRFRSWFHRTPDKRIIVEHGHQYDPLCMMQRMFARVSPDGTAVLEDTVGTVGTHFGQALFGLLNPYATDPFEFAAGGMGMLRACIGRAVSDLRQSAAALSAFREMTLVRPEDPTAVDLDDWLAFIVHETGSPRAKLERHRALWAPKADASVLTHAVAGTADYGQEVSARLSSAMDAIADIHTGTRAVVTGHTHEPFVYSDRAGRRFFANAGSWTPPVKPDQPVGTFVTIADDSGGLAGALRTVWPDGSIT